MKRIVIIVSTLVACCDEPEPIVEPPTACCVPTLPPNTPPPYPDAGTDGGTDAAVDAARVISP